MLKKIDMAEKVKNNKRPGVKKWIGGAILADDRVTRQIPFLIFLAFLAVLLITNRNWSERTIRNYRGHSESNNNTYYINLLYTTGVCHSSYS